MDELSIYQDRLRIALKSARICIFEVDLLNQMYTFFENAEDIFGVTDDIILKEVQEFSKLDSEAYRIACSAYFAHPEDEVVIEKAFADVLKGKSATYEARMRASGSSYVWCRVNVTPILKNGVPSKMIGIIIDISDSKKETDDLKKEAHRDDFTGLYKKGYAISRMKKAILQNRQGDYTLAMLDIDNFKNVNDTYGHTVGDKVIKELVLRFKEVFSDGEIIGRFGGDEFFVLINYSIAPCDLVDMFAPLIQFETDGITCTCSVGIARYPQDGMTFDELFQKADMALYKAKFGGGVIYSTF